jgi:hypothetical protein
MGRIFIILGIIFIFSFEVMALQPVQPNIKKLKKKRGPASNPTLRIVPVLPEIKGTSPVANRDWEGKILWEKEFKNMKQDPIPKNMLEYKVYQSIGGKQSVLMTRGTIHDKIEGHEIYKLKGSFLPCCSYNRITIEILNKAAAGKLLSSSTGEMPTFITRSTVKVENVFVSLKRVSKKKTIRKIKAEIRNVADHNINVNVVVHWKKKETQNWVRLFKKSILIHRSKGNQPVKAYNIHDDRVSISDSIRIEISEDSPIMCPRQNCQKYPTWEGVVGLW